jgi:hypothetical protein
MPTVLRIGPYRFFFYSNEGNEPPHIHVESGDSQAKFWLEPITLAANFGFRSRDLAAVQVLVGDHVTVFLEAWNDYFGNP